MKEGLRWTLKERYVIRRSKIKCFIRGLFKKCSIFEGFKVTEPITLERRKKYLVIQGNFITENGHINVK